MKRFFTMIVAVCAFLTTSAQYPMVTHSHNEELTFFSNITALNSTIVAAENGNVLYLSEGTYFLENVKLDIFASKRLSIVGAGYKSHIIGDVKVFMTTSTSDSDTPLFDGINF